MDTSTVNGVEDGKLSTGLHTKLISGQPIDSCPPQASHSTHTGRASSSLLDLACNLMDDKKVAESQGRHKVVKEAG